MLASGLEGLFFYVMKVLFYIEHVEGEAIHRVTERVCSLDASWDHIEVLVYHGHSIFLKEMGEAEFITDIIGDLRV